MKKPIILTIAMVLASTGAFANEHLKDIATNAKNLRQGFLQMSTSLKAKDFPVDTIKQELQKIDADIVALKELAAKYEASAPTLSAAASKEWNTTKEMILLLDIFHERKTQLLASDPQKNRNMLRQEAQRLAHRANVLHESATRLSAGSGD